MTTGQVVGQPAKIDNARASANVPRGETTFRSRLFDHFVLLKPRVMSLVVFTGGVGIYVAPGRIDGLAALTTLVCMAAGAGACGALNMWYDADIDAVMRRTAGRPIPNGRVSPPVALIIGILLSIVSVLTLSLLVNWVAGALLALTIGFYFFVYTMGLKRRTPQNIVIGGAAGALPPVIGWSAVTGGIDPGALALFAIIFLWTPPHFWALALCRSSDYEIAGVPMMPNVAGAESTARQIVIYSALLVPATFVPVALRFEGPIYATVALVLGIVFMVQAIAIQREKDVERRNKIAYKFFGFSIIYLFVLFVALLIGAK
jgi:protoheme IX farnesyltransferase